MKKDSWLYSDSFLKRAFAIYGYNLVAGLIIAVPFMILWFIMAGFFITMAFKHGMPMERGGMMMENDRGTMMEGEMNDGMNLEVR